MTQSAPRIIGSAFIVLSNKRTSFPADVRETNPIDRFNVENAIYHLATGDEFSRRYRDPVLTSPASFFDAPIIVPTITNNIPTTTKPIAHVVRTFPACN